MKVSAVIPAYNEEGWVGDTINTLRKLEGINEVIVVDDGSEDNTFPEAVEAGASSVLRLPQNRGKGYALRKGVIISSGDVIAFVDADTKETAEEITKIIEPVINGETDMAIGAFSIKGGGGIGFTKKLAYWSLFFATGFKAESPLSGQRALTRTLCESIDFNAEGFAVDIALSVETLRFGFRIKEVPVRMYHRVGCKKWKDFYHRAKQSIDVLNYFWMKRREVLNLKRWTKILL